MKPRARGRLLQVAMAALSLIGAWLAWAPAQALGKECAADGVTCVAILPILPLLLAVCGLVLLIAAAMPSTTEKDNAIEGSIIGGKGKRGSINVDGEG